MNYWFTNSPKCSFQNQLIDFVIFENKSQFFCFTFIRYNYLLSVFHSHDSRILGRKRDAVRMHVHVHICMCQLSTLEIKTAGDTEINSIYGNHFLTIFCYCRILCSDDVIFSRLKFWGNTIRTTQQSHSSHWIIKYQEN